MQQKSFISESSFRFLEIDRRRWYEQFLDNRAFSNMLRMTACRLFREVSEVVIILVVLVPASSKFIAMALTYIFIVVLSDDLNIYI